MPTHCNDHGIALSVKRRDAAPQGGSNSLLVQETFLLSTVARLALGSKQPPIQLILGALSPGLMRHVLEADHLASSSAKVRNGGDKLPLPHTSSWHGAYLSTGTSPFTFSMMCLRKINQCCNMDVVKLMTDRIKPK
jgi:hypothetical protein